MTLNGLSLAAVAQSRKKYGANTMPDPRVKSAWDFLVDVFRTKINLILLIMAGLFIGLALLGYGDIIEAIGIGIVHNTKRPLTSFAMVSSIGSELKCLAKQHEKGSFYILDRRS